MIVRRLNFTERKRIDRRRVCIRLVRDGEERRFNAEIDLRGMDLPEDARVFVEAYYRSNYRRFDFGTVGRIEPPRDCNLAAFPNRKPSFRVKVVGIDEEGFARILASAEHVVPLDADEEDRERKPLLEVVYEDLGERVWKLELDGERPTLVVNARIDGIREAVRAGPEFLCLVFPEVVGGVLRHVVVVENRTDFDEGDEDWQADWLRYAISELGLPRPPGGEDSRREQWVEDAIAAFCRRHGVRERFARCLREAGD